MSIRSILQNKPCDQAEKEVVEKLRQESKSEKLASTQSAKQRDEVRQLLHLIKEDGYPDRKIKKPSKHSFFYLPRLAFASLSLCIACFLTYKGFEKPEKKQIAHDLTLIDDLAELKFQLDFDFVTIFHIESSITEEPTVELDKLVSPIIDFGSLFTNIQIIPPIKSYFPSVENLGTPLVPKEFRELKENTKEGINNLLDSIPFFNEIFPT